MVFKEGDKSEKDFIIVGNDRSDVSFYTGQQWFIKN